MSEYFSIGYLAAQSFCSVETIRFYEKKGLITPVMRMPSGYRKYNEESLQRLSFISRSKDLGFTLQEIGELLQIHEDDCDLVRKRSEQKLADIRTKIRNLKSIENALVDLNRACIDRDSKVCPILSFLGGELISLPSELVNPLTNDER